jgi:hypothetical protein
MCLVKDLKSIVFRRDGNFGMGLVLGCDTIENGALILLDYILV